MRRFAIIPIIVIAALAAVLLLAGPVQADEPCDQDFRTGDLGGWNLIQTPAELTYVQHMSWQFCASLTQLSEINSNGIHALLVNNELCDNWYDHKSAIVQLVSPDLTVGSGGGTLQFTIAGGGNGSLGADAQWHAYKEVNGVWSGSLGNYGNGTHVISTTVITAGVTRLMLVYAAASPWLNSLTSYLQGVTVTNISCPGGDASDCATVQNPDFSSANGWTLVNAANVYSDNLILGLYDAAGQNVTLDTGNYNAVISVTSATDLSQLDLTLGQITQTLTITGAGVYTSANISLTDLGGPVVYSLQNSTNTLLEIDYTCIYRAGSTRGECLGPVNGDFSTGDSWAFWRGAAWDSLAQLAWLPYNVGDDKSLLLTTTPFTIPELTDGQYLLMSFEAQSANGQAAYVASRVEGIENAFEVYPSLYTFEADLTALTGATGTNTIVNLAFSNIGSMGGFAAEDDINLDNVCVFVADQGPQLPTQSDPGGDISPANFGFNYTCDDVPGILAAFGINVAQMEADYLNRPTVWDPANYIPWLASALWHNAGHPITCLQVEQMRLAAGIGEQQINEFLNVANWSIRSNRLAVAWLQNGFIYLKNAIFNPANWGRGLAAGWLNWAAAGWRITENNAAALNADTINAINSLSNQNVLMYNQGIGPGLEYLVSGTGSIPVDVDPLLPGLDVFGFIWALVDLLWWLAVWIWQNVIAVSSIPFQFYRAFDAGVKSSAYSLVTCSGDNFWCIFLVGVQLFNGLTAHWLFYPVVIIGMILSTLVITWNNFKDLFVIELK